MAVKLKELITKETVIFLETLEMEDTIDALVGKAKVEGLISDEKSFKEAVLEREELVSTGIGLGVAIPHAKVKELDKFFVIVGLNKNGLDWDAIDRNPVGAVFLIGGPEKQQKKYLQIIAKLILLIKNPERRQKLLNAQEEQEIVEIFQEF